MALDILVGLCVQILQNGEREDTLVSLMYAAVHIQ